MKIKAPSSFETPETNYPVTRRHPKRMKSKDTAVKTSRLLIYSFYPSFFLVLAFISSLFASLFHLPNPPLSNLTVFFLLLLFEPETLFRDAARAARLDPRAAI